jgi:hypothetical protein
VRVIRSKSSSISALLMVAVLGMLFSGIFSPARADDERTPTNPAEPDAEACIHRRAPPMIDPPGMISIRTARGWLTIPKTWIGSHVLPEDQAKFERCLRDLPP